MSSCKCDTSQLKCDSCFKDMGSSSSKYYLDCRLCIKTLNALMYTTQAHRFSRRHRECKIKIKACKSCLNCYKNCSQILSKRNISLIPLPRQESTDPGCIVYHSCLISSGLTTLKFKYFLTYEQPSERPLSILRSLHRYRGSQKHSR